MLEIELVESGTKALLLSELEAYTSETEVDEIEPNALLPSELEE